MKYFSTDSDRFQHFSILTEQALYIFLTYDSLPYLKKILSEKRENFNENLCTYSIRRMIYRFPVIARINLRIFSENRRSFLYAAVSHCGGLMEKEYSENSEKSALISGIRWAFLQDCNSDSVWIITGVFNFTSMEI